MKNSLHRGPLPWVFAFMLLCLLPIMILRDFSPSNELRYLSIADEALRDGHFFAFFYQGEIYADKPPLYLWIVMLCRLLFGRHSMFALSLFSLIPAFVIMAVMDSWIKDEFPTARAALALMLGTCLMFLGMSVSLRMDMLMCMFIVLAINSFYRACGRKGNPRRQTWLIPLWTFLALFTKGPVGMLVPLVSILCFLIARGDFRDVGDYLGWKFWLLLAALCALWFTGVYADGGRAYLDELVVHQTLGRAVNSFHHAEPVWYYLLAVWYCLAPYCLLLVGCLLSSLLLRGHRSSEEVLLSSVILSSLVMLSAFSAKLAIYLAPVFPFMVYLFPFVEKRVGERAWMRWALALPAALLALASLSAIVAVLFFPEQPPLAGLLADYPFVSSAWIMAGLGMLALGNILALLLIKRRFDWQLPVCLMSASILLLCLLAGPVMPEINKYTAYGTLCRKVPQDSRVLTYSVHRPEAMDVYLGRRVVNCGNDMKALEDSLSVLLRPLTLITPSSQIEGDPGLKAIAASGSAISEVGPYSIIELD